MAWIAIDTDDWGGVLLESNNIAMIRWSELNPQERYVVHMNGGQYFYTSKKQGEQLLSILNIFQYGEEP